MDVGLNALRRILRVLPLALLLLLIWSTHAAGNQHVLRSERGVGVYSRHGRDPRRVSYTHTHKGDLLIYIVRDGAYLLHPAILDACIQVTAYKPFHGNFDPNVYYLPAHVDAVIIHQPLRVGYFPAHIYAHVELKAWTPGK